jgi:hypothetical protein
MRVRNEWNDIIKKLNSTKNTAKDAHARLEKLTERVKKKVAKDQAQLAAVKAKKGK